MRVCLINYEISKEFQRSLIDIFLFYVSFLTHLHSSLCYNLNVFTRNHKEGKNSIFFILEAYFLSCCINKNFQCRTRNSVIANLSYDHIILTANQKQASNSISSDQNTSKKLTGIMFIRLNIV